MSVFCSKNVIKHKINVNFLKCYENKKYSTQTWKGVVGLEVHAKIDSASKLFSASSTDFKGRVNNNVSLFDAATPGTLPVINKKCVESGILTALALNCTVNPLSLFDRKHYFYADLPAGYQITQQRKPLASYGTINFQVFQPGVHKKPYLKVTRIKQIQLEQDSGKSLHDDIGKRTLIDLNRAGAPLMEIVFEPDLDDGEEAAALVKELVRILKALKTCNCKMEEGSLRVDANVSVHQPGTPLGVRSEIKNIGSIRGVAHAVEFEIKRQTRLLACGANVINETRNWDAGIGETVPMRDKEEKQDYRFMPEPNLPPLFVNVSHSSKTSKNRINVADVKPLIPELPNDTRNRLLNKYNINPEMVFTLMEDEELMRIFTNIINQNSKRSPPNVTKFLVIELLRFVNQEIITLEQCDERIVTALGEIIDLLDTEDINVLIAREILLEVINGNNLSPVQIMEDRGWKQITDPKKIKQLCEDVINKNPKMVAQYKKGKEKVYKAIMRQIKETSNKCANVKLADEILKELLKK